MCAKYCGNHKFARYLFSSTGQGKNITGIVGEVLVNRDDLEGETALETLLTQSGLCSSLSDARRQLSQSAVLINNERISPVAATEALANKLTDKLLGNYLLLQRGKKERRLVIVE